MLLASSCTIMGDFFPGVYALMCFPIKNFNYYRLLFKTKTYCIQCERCKIKPLFLCSTETERGSSDRQHKTFTSINNKNQNTILFKILFIFRYMGREGEREAEKHQCVVASREPPTGDLACNPGLCPDWESNRRPFSL